MCHIYFSGNEGKNLMAKFDTYEELAALVDKSGSVLAVTMGQLRVVHQAGKLGVTVVANIHDRLESLGLGHAPSDLPRDQSAWSLIFRKGSAVARLISAAHYIDEKSATTLREFASKDSRASETLEKIKELVSD